MTFLPPGERIDGTPAECAHLHLLLSCFRASPPPMRLPDVTGRPLPELLGEGNVLERRQLRHKDGHDGNQHRYHGDGIIGGRGAPWGKVVDRPQDHRKHHTHRQHD